MAFTAAGLATDYVDLLDKLITLVTANGWTVKMQTQEAASAVVAAGGTGYSVSDQLTVLGGAGVTTAAVFNVDTVGGSGEVLTVSLVTAGAYDYPPANPASTSGGGGSGCTLTVTHVPVTGITVPKKVILEGSGAGSDEIFVSIRAEDLGGGIYDWQLQGHTGFQDQVDPTLQPNTSPGVHVPLNNASIRYWIFVNPNRIIGVFRMGSTYTNMYLGFLDRFGTAAQYPYPLAVFGCATIPTIFSDSVTGMGGLADPISNSSDIAAGAPAYIHDPAGVWKQVKNAGGSAGFRPKFRNLVVTPAGLPTSGGTWRTDSFFIPSQGAPLTQVGQVPDSTATSGFRFPLLPCVLVESSPTPQLLGALNNVVWAGTLTENTGQAVSEDIYNINGTDYVLFQNVNRTDHWTVFLIKRV